MLLETVGAVCHAAGVAIAFFAGSELLIHEADKRRRLRCAVHTKFLNLAQREIFCSFSLQDLEWGQELGSGCIGQVFKGHLKGVQVAVKTPKLDGPLGEESVAAIRREMKLAMRVHHSCLCPLLGWFAGPVTFSAWEFVPNTATMRDVLLQPVGCNLVGALTFLANTLAFLDAKSLPLFDCHPLDICILDNDSGMVKILDWTDGFDNSLGGNLALLPAAWRTGPQSRLSLVNSLGVSIAAMQINSHVLGYYVAAVAVASEMAVDRNSLHAVAHAELPDGSHAASMVIQDDWRYAAESYFHHRLEAADWPQTNLPMLTPKRRLPPLERPPPLPMAPPPPPPFPPPPAT